MGDDPRRLALARQPVARLPDRSPSRTSTWKCSSNACRSRNAASNASRSALIASVNTWSSIGGDATAAAVSGAAMSLVASSARDRRRRGHADAQQPRRAQHADRRRWSTRSSPRWTRSRPTSRSVRSSSPAPRRRSAPAPTSATWPRPTGPACGAIYEGFLRIARSPLPTLAAVNGAAVGAGMNLALGCDVRLAARRAKFDTRFLQIGLHPAAGTRGCCGASPGPQAAMAAVVFGEVLDGAEAERVGLAYRCVDDDAAARRRAGDGRPGRRRTARAGDRHQADHPGDGRRRRLTRRPSSASSSRRCGAPGSRGSPSASPRCRRRSARSRSTGSDCQKRARMLRESRLPHPCRCGLPCSARVAPTPYIPTTQRRYFMSQRHRSQEAVPPPKMDLRAHAHNERHRIHSELDAVAAQVSAGYEPDEVHEPGRAWVPSHHHDAEKAQGPATATTASATGR